MAEPEQLCAEDIIKAEGIRPVNRRSDFPYKGTCPWCGADNKYLYLNNGRRQYACKVCKKTVTDKVVPRGTSGYYCPHCGRSMMNSETMADEAEAEWFGDTDEGEDE